MKVNELDMLLLDTAEIKDFKRVLDGNTEVDRVTDKAILIRYDYDGELHWIPLSLARLGHDGALWVKEWFYKKELS